MATTGKVTGIIANLVTVRADGPVAQNEICHITLGDVTLMAEVIKITGDEAYTQVFESTRGLAVGADVTFSGRMLEVELGPGILSRNFDGLQNDLDRMPHLFLRRGDRTVPLDREREWDFTPLAKPGDAVEAGTWLGEVTENWLAHKIMAPFTLAGRHEVRWMAPAGRYRVTDKVAVLAGPDGKESEVSMVQRWPVKLPIRAYREKRRPFRIMETGVRVIDTLNPIAEGGTGFIPGPFGCGKTVLQHSLAKNAAADMIIVAACGERANEVVELFVEFPHLDDPRTGRKLMERTTIVCNTSNMPVAAREASVYTAMTIGEYYRSMGLRVLLLADSTSRWAQALREMSNRMEELPGPDAFPMDLTAIIANFYARAGFVELAGGATGSITFIGTVSPAGGNLKEPVTEATKKAARCFYALAQSRADSKRYPAIDPVDSYSKYLEYDEVRGNLAETMSPDWVADVYEARDILIRGREAWEQINILGDDGVPVEYHVRHWKAEVLDFAVLQQDGFDAVDSSTPLARQRALLGRVLGICRAKYRFESFEETGPFFKQVINLLKQGNYSVFESEQYRDYDRQLTAILAEAGRVAATEVADAR